MSLAKKITQIFSLVFLIFLLASCEEKGCIDSDEFDVESLQIKSKPDEITGTYPIQQTKWQETGLKSNGERFLIRVKGSWTAWNGNGLSSDSLNNMPRCRTCARKEGVTNCICYKNQNPLPTLGGDLSGADTTNSCTTDSQNDPKACSCTKNFGSASQPTILKDTENSLAATDNGIYHVPLDYFWKDKVLLDGFLTNPENAKKVGDHQTQCKFDRGMGAYIGLFGTDSNTVPTRVYHLFSEEEVCNITRDSNGKCLDAGGKDQTSYVFRSANERIFLKNDNNGNDGNDTDTTNDEYHAPREAVKFTIADTYYSDNYGDYDVEILHGVGNDRTSGGLLEFIVTMVEEVVLGKISDGSGKVEAGEREGGIIEFMYKSIVQDSVFILVVQISLALYISLFGAAHLWGLVELSRKELMGRVLKISLIIFFTSKDSWYFYNHIIVSFFKDGMDTLVSMIMDLSDRGIDDSSLTKVAQMSRDNAVSQATRFSYADIVIKKLFSVGVSKKIWGLVFGTGFGIFYALAIYALIGFFVYVMLYVATVYLINLMKIVFVLSLGPIFFCFTLFSHTAGMFKSWLAFLGARSLEIILLFLVLYNFLMLIDKNFTSILSYEVCYEGLGVDWRGKEFKLFGVLVAKVSGRDFIDWMILLLNTAGLIFITKLVIEKVGDVAGKLISIGGASGGAGSSSFALAGKMTDVAGDLALRALSTLDGYARTALRNGLQGARNVARNSAVAKAWDKFKSSTGLGGISGPIEMFRNFIIDRDTKAATEAVDKAAAASGKPQTAIERDAAIRLGTMNIAEGRNNNVATQIFGRNTMSAFGVDKVNIARRLDQTLLFEPAKKAMQAKARELKNDPTKVTSREGRMQIKQAGIDWANNNSSATKNIDGTDKIVSFLKESKMKNFLRNESELTPKEAANRYEGNPDLQNKYLQHLKENQARMNRKNQDAFLRNIPGRIADSIKYHTSVKSPFSYARTHSQNLAANPRNAEKDFMKEIEARKAAKDAPMKKIEARKAAKDAPMKKIEARKAEAEEHAKAERERADAIKASGGRVAYEISRAKKAARKAYNESRKVQQDQASVSGQKALTAILAKGVGLSKAKNLVTNDAFATSEERDAASKARRKGLKANRERDFYLDQARELAQRDLRGWKGKDLKDKVLNDLSDPNKTTFEKAARLSYLQKESGINGVDAQAVISKAMVAHVYKLFSDGSDGDFEKLRKLRGGMFAGNFDVKKALGGEEGIEKLLTKAGEDKAGKSDVGADQVAQLPNGPVVTSNAEHTLSINEQINLGQNAVHEFIALAEFKESIKKDGINNLINTNNIELQFGIKSLEDAIGLKASDIRLKAGNPLLGNMEDLAVDPKGREKSQLHSALKMKKFNKNWKEFELGNLEKTPEGNERKIAELKREVEDLERDISREEVKLKE